MANEKALLEFFGKIEGDVTGVIAAAVVDLESGMTLAAKTNPPDPVPRKPILELLVTTPVSAVVLGAPVVGSRNFPPKILTTSTVSIVNVVALLRNTKLSP